MFFFKVAAFVLAIFLAIFAGLQLFAILFTTPEVELIKSLWPVLALLAASSILLSSAGSNVRSWRIVMLACPSIFVLSIFSVDKQQTAQVYLKLFTFAVLIIAATFLGPAVWTAARRIRK